LGYERVWFAEHHGMPSIASSSPEILIAHIAAATERIRVGSGGIMLPNHVPLKVAENFHTLEALHPGRVDLGIGRAPGTDQATVRALRSFDASKFASQLNELMSLSAGTFPPEHPFSSIRVVPDDVSLPPIWLLGSSGASAKFAGQLGLGYSFASHFSETPAGPALDNYRANFEPSEQFPTPHVIVAVSVVCAETDEEADFLASTLDLSQVRLRSGKFLPLAPPEVASAQEYTAFQRSLIEQNRRRIFVGSPETVRAKLGAFAREAQADELMVMTMTHSPEARLRSYELLAEAMEVAAPTPPK
jgi:luciferase family oxidoreductase group 1